MLPGFGLRGGQSLVLSLVLDGSPACKLSTALSDKMLYLTIFQLLYLPELHLALRFLASESEEVQHPVKYPHTKNESKKLILLGLGLLATRYSAISGTRVTLLLMCGHMPKYPWTPRSSIPLTLTAAQDIPLKCCLKNE